MTREELNKQPAQLVRIDNNKVVVIKEGTRHECWNAKVQTVSRCYLTEGNCIVVLKKKKNP